MNVKKVLFLWGIAVLVWLYTTLVLQNLWNWFAVDALNAPHVSYRTMYGLLMIVNLVFEKDTFLSDAKFTHTNILISACVPVDKWADVNEQLKDEEGSLVFQLGTLMVGKVAGSTLVFALGWAVHMFLT
jgi:hypothetical protein